MKAIFVLTFTRSNIFGALSVPVGTEVASTYDPPHVLRTTAELVIPDGWIDGTAEAEMRRSMRPL